MVRFLTCVVCLFAGVLTGPAFSATNAAADGTPALAARDWTDASGKRHARAHLIHVDGEKLSLRRADGKLVNTTLPQLSEQDRYYVETLQLKPAKAESADAESPREAKPLLQKAIDHLPSLDSLPTMIADAGAGADQKPSPVPATLVYLHISRAFLEDYVDRTVSRTKPVKDYILGTRIVGESYTRGKTRLVLQPSDDHALGDVEFSGTVHSRTVGYNGPAIFHYLADSKFQAHKRIVLGDSGLEVETATASAPTRLKVIDIESRSPGLRGRIVERVASRRESKSREQANAIASNHTAAIIRNDLDERINASVAAVQKTLRSQVPELDFDRESMPSLVRFRSTPDYVEVEMVRGDASPEEIAMQAPAIDGNPDIAVRVHRSVVGRVATDPQLREKMLPLLVNLLKARVAQTMVSMLPGGADPLPSYSNWSIGLDWLTLDFTDASRQEMPLTIATQGVQDAS